MQPILRDILVRAARKNADARALHEAVAVLEYATERLEREGFPPSMELSPEGDLVLRVTGLTGGKDED